MSELIAMYSVDGYAAGKIVEVHLDGNTNVNGRNAAGKTALLKMVPSFYGVAPRTLQREETNNQSFANYYLPNTTSYLAFVYNRNGQFATVVITRKSGTGSLVYRFVLGRCENSWFLQEMAGVTSFVTSTNWRSHMIQAGYQVAASVGYDDYCLIIQSSQLYRSSDRKKAQRINEYRSLYSYPTHGRDISNIHLLASAILQRKPSMAAIKAILESVLINQNVIDESELKVNLAANKVEEWIDNRRAYLLIEAQRTNIINIAEHQEKFDQVRTRLAEVKSLSILRKDELEQQQAALTAASLQCTQDLGEYNQQADKQRQAAKLEVGAIKEQMKAQYEIAEGLTLRKNRFERQDVPSQRARAHRVDELQIQHRVAAKNLNDLQSGIKDLTDHYQQLIASIETETQSKKTQLNEQKSGYQSAHKDQLLIEQEQYRQQSSSLDSQLNLTTSAVRQEITRLAEEIGRLGGQLENVGPAAEISAQLRETNQELRQCHADADSTRADVGLAESALAQAKRVCDEGIMEQRRLDKAVEHHAHELELARSRLIPKEGSLLSFLHANRS
ncbi:MAG: ATP-binding protein, partial [Oceanisphaera sp.]